MKVHRTIPPAATSIDLKSIFHGLAGFFRAGTYLRKREDELRDYFGVKHVFMVSSGKAALTLILNGLKSLSPDKKEVLIPAYTCFSVPSAILRAGLRVSLCDVKNTDFDVQFLERRLKKETLCVIPTHLFGIPSDVSRIKELCYERGIYVIEDGAQAMGGVYRGQLGTNGDVGFFSLGRGKNITCGNGGLVITNSDMIAEAIGDKYSLVKRPRLSRSLMEFLRVVALAIFIHPSLYWLPAGLPFLRLGETIFYTDFPIERLSGMQAGVLHNWRRRLEKANRARQNNAKYLIETLGLRRACDCSVPFLRLPVVAESIELRNRILSVSREKGLGISRVYPVPVHEIPEIKAFFAGEAFPEAEVIAERLLTVPTHEFLSEKDREAICGLFAEALHKRPGNFNAVMQAKN